MHGDAMPNGGHLTLETSNVSLDTSAIDGPEELNAGDYAPSLGRTPSARRKLSS
jgi:hypothetical protein